MTINEPIFLDIAITDVNAPIQVTKGDFVTIKVTIQNQGNRDITGPITIRIFDEKDETTIETQTLNNGLEKGGSVVLPFNNWDTNLASVGSHKMAINHNFSDDDPSDNSVMETILVEEPQRKSFKRCLLFGGES